MNSKAWAVAAALVATGAAQATCYSVHRADGTLIVETSTTPVNLTLPLGDTVPEKFGQGAFMTMSDLGVFCKQRRGPAAAQRRFHHSPVAWRGLTFRERARLGGLHGRETRADQEERARLVLRPEPPTGPDGTLRPKAIFLPPPWTLLSVAHARASALGRPTPFCPELFSMAPAWRFCWSVYADLSPRGMSVSLRRCSCMMGRWSSSLRRREGSLQEGNFRPSL